MATTAAYSRADTAPVVAPRVRTRVQSLDVLIGTVMVIMALDHTRDFLHNQAQLFSPVRPG